MLILQIASQWVGDNNAEDLECIQQCDGNPTTAGQRILNHNKTFKMNKIIPFQID